MKPMHRGVAVAAIQCLLVLSLAGKYAIDRERLPRAWARTLPVDPNAPIRGRYVSLRVEVEVAPGRSDMPPSSPAGGPVQLSAQNGRLVGTPAMPPGNSGTMLSEATNRGWTLREPVAFFIPENVPDPSRRASGEELWVEVSVPRQGPPRPVRLGVRKGGVLTPLELR